MLKLRISIHVTNFYKSSQPQRHIISTQIDPPTAQSKILNSDKVTKENLPLYYSMPFVVTTETKLSIFHYKIIHDILPANSLLFKMKITDTTKCPLCQDQIHDIRHMFVKCPSVITFWHHFHKWYTFDDDLKRSLTPTEILYGVINRKKLNIALNHIVIITKFHIYKSNINEIPPNFRAFLSLLKEKINIEKYLSCIVFPLTLVKASQTSRVLYYQLFKIKPVKIKNIFKKLPKSSP